MRSKFQTKLHMMMLANLWRFSLVGIVLLQITGCSDWFYEGDNSMPAPVRNDFPYEITGAAFSQFMGDSFMFNADGKIHFIILKGVDTPKDGQPFHLEAKRTLRAMIRYKTSVVKVVERDKHHREIGFAYCTLSEDANESGQSDDLSDVGLELIRLGLGWYDGSSFKDADLYRAAENQARGAKVGLWEQQAPEPPWDYEAKKSASPND